MALPAKGGAIFYFAILARSSRIIFMSINGNQPWEEDLRRAFE